ncbi:hypothetical protein K438DRAFT_1977599 [Mycena galopus ATCC 62051]|nr:hypothetical protein K438DRAFT_1977599 [Mycena galopus ATCC 62051]
MSDAVGKTRTRSGAYWGSTGCTPHCPVERAATPAGATPGPFSQASKSLARTRSSDNDAAAQSSIFTRRKIYARNRRISRLTTACLFTALEASTNGRISAGVELLAPTVLDLISVPTAAALKTTATHSVSASPLTRAVRLCACYCDLSAPPFCAYMPLPSASGPGPGSGGHARRVGVVVRDIGEYGNGDEFGRDECTLKYLGLRTLAAPSAPMPGVNVSQTARFG